MKMEPMDLSRSSSLDNKLCQQKVTSQDCDDITDNCKNSNNTDLSNDVDAKASNNSVDNGIASSSLNFNSCEFDDKSKEEPDRASNNSVDNGITSSSLNFNSCEFDDKSKEEPDRASNNSVDNGITSSSLNFNSCEFDDKPKEEPDEENTNTPVKNDCGNSNDRDAGPTSDCVNIKDEPSSEEKEKRGRKVSKKISPRVSRAAAAKRDNLKIGKEGSPLLENDDGRTRLRVSKKISPRVSRAAAAKRDNLKIGKGGSPLLEHDDGRTRLRVSKKISPRVSRAAAAKRDNLKIGKEGSPLLENDDGRTRLRVSKSPTTPEMSTPSRPKKARRELKLGDDKIEKCLDSGSEFESDGDDEVARNDIILEERLLMRQFRDEVVVDGVKDLNGRECENEERVSGDGVVESREQPPVGQVGVFSWSDNFSSFSGQKETYIRSPGPTVGSQDPVKVFLTVWNDSIMNEIVNETNRYAWQIIAPLSETENGLPNYLEWTDVSVSEMYRYFAMLIYMSLCYRTRIKEYWTKGFLEMPHLRRVMSRDRFLIITRFLHFVNNEKCDPSMSAYEKKIYKIVPIVKHCNKKFAELYIPSKHLSLDESLLLWKGRLSWVQCIRTKAARFGIKSFELCEATTGYQLRCLIYAGKNSSMFEESIYGFENSTAKVVLELMDGYLDVGHTLVMDNWYNQLPLTRFLKRRRTDVIGTINRRQIHIPHDIKDLVDKRMQRSQQVARHCGDISLIAWKDVKLVTVMSTYHNDSHLPARRAGESISKPISVIDYNKYMGGVDSKDQKLSMFPMERKRGQKWYMKVFKRLLNTSLLNTYIIYSKNPMPNPLTHREFRYEVARGLLECFSVSEENPVHRAPPVPALDKDLKRLQIANHFPAHSEKIPGKNKLNQRRCVRCTAAGRRSMVTTMCTFCNVPLCIGPCWVEYHTFSTKKLRK